MSFWWIGLTLLQMTRNPCKVPTDVRKVRAVEHPLLRSYTDVIVCSVQGHRRLLDFLAGVTKKSGDYDGDTAIVIWTPEIVEHFKNADEKYANEPPDVDECFTSNNEKVGDFQIRTAGMTPLEKTFEVQSYLLRALRDSFEVGHYSTMHDRAVYQLGYSHPESISLAYKFCKVLDGAKNGLKIRKDAYDKDRNAYPASRLSWKETAKSTEEEGRSAACRNEAFARRSTDSPHVKGKFIMDILQSAAKKERDRILARIEDPSLFGRRNNVSDPHLTEPWKTAVEASGKGDPRVVKAMKNDLQKIQHHVEELYQEHKDRRMPIQHEGKSRSFTSLPIEVRQDILRAFSKRFASYPTSADMEVHTDPALIARLRASYAFTYDLQQKASSNSWSRFSWDLAMRDLCLIKANALGPSKTVTTGFYERFKMARR
ncbi:hypothetical protein H0H93_010704 [Arthromyces matolae]|nr:hypothetical protein H0H93_010704 [Arthromyces matolae]